MRRWGHSESRLEAKKEGSQSVCRNQPKATEPEQVQSACQRVKIETSPRQSCPIGRTSRRRNGLC